MMAGPTRDIAQFGAPLGEYRGGFARILYSVGGIVIAALGVFLLYGAVFGGSEVSTTIILLIFGLALAVLGGYMFWLVIASWGTRVQLFEGGFSATQLGKTTTAAWGDVASINQAITRIRYYGIPVWTSYNYRLALTNGQKLRLTETIGKVSKMGEAMQTQITHTLTPRALEALRTGATLPFGKLSVTPMGISNGAETLPWHEISNVTVQNGVIIVGKVGKRLRWTSASVAKTPNAYVFLSLVDMMRRGAQPGMQPGMQPGR
jgi:uncharacterized protein DUF6585